VGRLSRKKYNALNAGVAREKKIASGENNVAVDFQVENVQEENSEDENANNIIPFNRTSDGVDQFEMKKSFSNQDDFNRIVFVSKSLQKDKILDVLRVAYKGVIHVEENGEKGSIVVGTDGYRLHYAEVGLTLSPGEYKIIVRKDHLSLSGPIKNEEGVMYPDWRKLIKDDLERCGSIDFHGTSLSRNIFATGLMSKKFYSLIRVTEKIINLRYLDDLSKERWDIYTDSQKELNSPLVFKQDLPKPIAAIIMPLFPEDG
jgi:hypothetical protein